MGGRYSVVPSIEREEDSTPASEKPYRRLLVAVLYQAIVDLTGKDLEIDDYQRTPWRVSEKEDATDWFLSRSKEPWSFRWILEMLDIEEKIVFEMIKAALKRNRQWRAPSK